MKAGKPKKMPAMKAVKAFEKMDKKSDAKLMSKIAKKV